MLNKIHYPKYLYDIWRGIVRRCLDIKCHAYNRYGGRGIILFKEWHPQSKLNPNSKEPNPGFIVFMDYILKFLGDRPSEIYSLDRINNDGHYEPGNLRWATPSEQNNNSRVNIKITYTGETKTLSEWCDIFGLNYSVINSRLRRDKNIPFDRLFSTSKLEQRRGKRGPYKKREKTNHIMTLAQKSGLSFDTVRSRLRRGWSIEDIINTPSKRKRNIQCD